MTTQTQNDPAMTGSKYTRHESDYYPTPAWVTEVIVPILLKRISPTTHIWEPACGSGEMAEVLQKHFWNVRATDIKDYGYQPATTGIDFLKIKEQCAERTAIITNPPYGETAEAFIRKALELSLPNGLVAMLLRNEYDSAGERIDLFNKPPFAEKVVLTSRPRWIPGTKTAPRHNYSWFIWDWRHLESPTISYVKKPK
jgi:hypothetical protein